MRKYLNFSKQERKFRKLVDWQTENEKKKSQLDLGFVNKKQLSRLIEEVNLSKLDIIGMQILKVKENMSVILNFNNEKDKTFFDTQSYNLVKDLNLLKEKDNA